GADRLQLDMVGIGDVLDRRLGPHFIGPAVGGEAGDMRRFHRDLGARHHEVIHLDRQPGDDFAEGIVDRDEDDRSHRQSNHRGHRDAQDPHHAAVPRGSGKARPEARHIGWILNRIHLSSRGAKCPYPSRSRPNMQPGPRGAPPQGTTREQFGRNGADLAPPRRIRRPP
ncbi:hypothetical protein NS44R_14825, partial [Mammaliicoccus sciuri]